MIVSPQVLLSHPGTQHSHRLAEQLHKRGLLYEFWTCFALTNEAWSTHLLQKFLPSTWQRRLANRILTGVSARRLRIIPLPEWKALRQLGQGKSSQSVFYERNQVFQERIPTLSLHNVGAVIGFDTSSWLLAQRSQVLGKPFFLVQSAAHPLVNEAILQKVVLRFPHWRTNIEARLPKVLACENQEYSLATKIVVSSSFTKKTLALNGVDAEKIIVNPHGVDLQLFHPPSHPRESGRLRFVFVGAVSAHKGVPLLLEAWQTLALKDSELWVVGPITQSVRQLMGSSPSIKILGSYPHEELPDLLRQCDILVFPSYSEGFGRVLLEALASGLPIITTDATAGPDMIQDGVEGYLIPSGNLIALCEAMKSLVDRRDKLRHMSAAARCCAKKFSLDKFGDRWQNILEEYT